jgi:hypothetical protein
MLRHSHSADLNLNLPSYQVKKSASIVNKGRYMRWWPAAPSQLPKDTAATQIC